MSSQSEEEKEIRRRKVEELMRKHEMKEKGGLSSSPSRTSDRQQKQPSLQNNAYASVAQPPITTQSAKATDAPPKSAAVAPHSSSNGENGSQATIDLDVDVDDVERILEKAARLLRDEEDRKVRNSIRLTSSPLSSSTSSSSSSSSSLSASSAAPQAATPAAAAAPPTAAASPAAAAVPPTPAPTPVVPPQEQTHVVQKEEQEQGGEEQEEEQTKKIKKKKKKKTSPRDENGYDKASSPERKKKKKKKRKGSNDSNGSNESNDGGVAAPQPAATAAEEEVVAQTASAAEALAKVAEEPERQPVEQMMPESNDSAGALSTSKDEEEAEEEAEAEEAEGGSSSSESSFEDNNNSLSPLTSPTSMSNEAEATTELGGPSSPDCIDDPDAVRHRATAWQKANFVAAKPSEQARRTVARPHSGGYGRTTRAFLGNRSSEPGSPAGGAQPSTPPAGHPALKLYRSVESGSSERTNNDDEAEDRARKAQAIKDRKSVYSMQLPTSSSGGGSEVSQAINASLARKWGAARRSGPVHTSFQDLMRLRSSSVIGNDFTGSGSLPVTTGSHTMTNKNDEYVIKFVHDDELFRIVCSCEMNASQIKAAMIQHVKAFLGIPDSDPKGKDKEDSESESESKSRPSSSSILSSSSSSSSSLSSSSSSSSSPRTSTSSPPPLGQSLDEKDYVLKIPGVNYYLVKEEQSLHLVGVLQVCKKSFVSFPLEMIPRPSTDVLHENDKLNVREKIMSELNANTEVFELLSNPISGDNPLLQILKSDNDEINSFRKRITKVRRAVLKEREALVRQLSEAHSNSKYDTSFLPQYRESEPLPLNLPNSFIILAYQPADEKDEVQTSTQKFSVTRNQTVAELKSNMFRKYKGTHPLATGTEEDYIVKVTGFKEYMIGSHKILSYDYIRKCLSKKVTPILSLVPLKDVDLMIPEPVEDSVVDMILSREKNVHMSKLRYKDQEPRKPISEMVQQLRVKINGVDNVDTFNHIIKSWMREQKGKKEHKEQKGSLIDDKDGGKKKTYCLYVCAQIYHGDELIADDMYTNAILYSNGPLWNEWLVSSVKLRDIPRGSRMCFTLYRRQLDNTVSAEAVFTEKGRFNEKTDVPLGWVNFQFIDHKDQLRQGLCSFKLWLGKPNPIGTCVENVAVKDKERATTLHVEFQIHRTAVYFPPPPTVNPADAAAAARGSSQPAPAPSSADASKQKIIKLQLEEIMKKDPLTALGEDERQLLWECREFCAQFPSLLPRFLQYVKWNDRESVLEAYRMLALWSPPTPFEALSLLDAKYASPVVRAYAVKRLHELDDRALSDFLLQLTQVLKYEAYHYSPLAEFLLSRALMNVNQIGHAFFWLLKSELHNPTIASRYSLLAEAYLRGCGAHRQELVKQNKVLNQLAKVAMRVKEAPSSSEKKKVLEDGLRRMEFPARFQLPLDPRQEVKGVIVDKCKYMDSKKQPLWLVFENAEKRGAPIRVIFKAGDDLRQDVLTLQMLRIMDKLWKEEGLDLRLNPYGCVATGDELGMIEVVLNASTTASVNKEKGGSKAVLYKDTLTSWLKEKNPSAEAFEAAQENFMLSCAGYCVATYVLGIGDRHNDNIMITQFGHLFHIDFGHFLGNVKSKLGIKRERAPFIFNPQFAHVLGGSQGTRYAQYVETCQRAYNIVRKHAHMFINLFMMMLSTGIPELQCEEDILYLCGSLLVGTEEKAAAENFAKLIEEARKTKSVLVNDIVHIWAHSKK